MNIDHNTEGTAVASTTPTTTITNRPIKESERVIIMDILRGFALIGILFMNIEWFNRPLNSMISFDFSQVGADYASGWLVLVFVEGKFYKLFSLLFGMGFAVMLLSAQQKGKKFAGMFTRRMLVLFTIGMAHMVFFWGGDILHDYAAGGLVILGYMALLQTKKLAKFNNPKSILKFAVGFMTFPLIVSLCIGIIYGAMSDHSELNEEWQKEIAIKQLYDDKKAQYDPSTNQVWPLNDEQPADQNEPVTNATTEGADVVNQEDSDKIDDMLSNEDLAQQQYESFVRQDAKNQKEILVATSGTFAEVTEYRSLSSLDYLVNTPIMAIFILFPIFLLGYWFIASGVLQDIDGNKALFKSMAYVGLVVGLMLNLTAVIINTHPASRSSLFLQGVGDGIYYYGQTIMMLGYVGFMALLSKRAKLSKLVNWMAPMGRMALTNYLMHSVILSSLFYQYGLGWFGQVSRSEQMLMVVSIVAFQAIFSKLWLSFFRFGPFEWMWRALTYLQWPPFIKS